MNIKLYYDKQCPFCNLYSKYVKLKKHNQLSLINVREEKKSIEELKNSGFDINDGFIIIVNDKDIYQGSNAIIFLNKLSEKKLFFKDNIFFKNVLYPSVKFLRKITLICLFKKTKL